MSRILGFLLLTEVAAIIFNTKGAIDQGFCHLQKVKIQVLPDCKLSYTSTVTIALAKNESDTSGNYILQCVWINGKSMNCFGDSDETGNYNGSTDILEIEFIFNDNKHAGLYLRITTDCNESSIALTPCRFTANVDFYNNSTINVTCQNPTFINSSSPIIIRAYRGNQYGSCLPQMCSDSTCKNLADGIQCVLPYDPDEMLQCQLYGAVFNITIPSSDTTPISSGKSSTPQNTEATESLDNSSASQSITSTSAESSTSKNDKNTPLMSPERTESEKTIYTTSKVSTDMTTSLPIVQQSKLSSKSPDWVKPVVISLGSTLLLVVSTIAFVKCGCRRFRNRSEENI